MNTWLKRLMQTMQPIKTITNRDPMFLKTAYKYDSLVNLQNDERFISVGEKYISYNGHWNVYKMTKGRLPRLFVDTTVSEGQICRQR